MIHPLPFSRPRFLADIEATAAAIRAGVLAPENPLIELISFWSAPYGRASTELVDFDAARGLAKTWVYLGGTRPVEQVLGAPHVPSALRRHGPSSAPSTWRRCGMSPWTTTAAARTSTSGRPAGSARPRRRGWWPWPAVNRPNRPCTPTWRPSHPRTATPSR